MRIFDYDYWPKYDVADDYMTMVIVMMMVMMMLMVMMLAMMMMMIQCRGGRRPQVIY